MKEFGKTIAPHITTRYQRLDTPAVDFSSPAGFDRLIKNLAARNLKYQMEQERAAARKRIYQGKKIVGK